MIRLRANFGQDEANHAGRSFRVSPWGTILVPPEAVPALTKTGGFALANDADEGVAQSTVADVCEAAWHLPRGKVRSTLLAILRSPNSMNHLIQSIAFT